MARGREKGEVGMKYILELNLEYMPTNHTIISKHTYIYLGTENMYTYLLPIVQFCCKKRRYFKRIISIFLDKSHVQNNNRGKIKRGIGR